MRGEHVTEHSSHMVRVGSSPHARGALVHGVGVRHVAGIIPACAGSTPTFLMWLRIIWDHPRMRGEHLVKGLCDNLHVGIIPACAGSTPSTARSSPRPGDHPRMRGEHWSRISDVLWAMGSSPHARGAR